MARAAKSGDAAPPRDAHPPAPAAGSAAKRLIARIWQGRTLATRADEYARYLHEAGVRKIAAIPGNRGVQMLRMVRGGIAEFQVLSYWDSVEAIKLFAGNDYEKVRHLPEDPRFMVGKEPTVEHFEVVVNDWPQRG